MTKNARVKEKKWILRDVRTPESDLQISRIAKDLGINPIIARLLYTRGYTDASSAKKFIYMESEMLCNPFDMKDMILAVERIVRALETGEKITVYGDYDVDGVTAVCTLYLYLKSKGANIDYYIPNRANEGYGVSKPAIDTIAEGGTTLIVTVDTGITASDEVAYAKTLGMDFVVTDHHECRAELPEAVAVVNPHRPDCPYPFKELAGVGVIFKVICALEERYSGKSTAEATAYVFSEYSDLVAIGTIADVMPIKDENRIIVSYGLKKIERTTRVGLIALMDASIAHTDASRNEKFKRRPKITSGYIGYTLAPRINAAGRIRSAELAVELFLSEDTKEARKIADELCRANKDRQQEENKIIQDANKKIEEMDITSSPVIVLDADDWHHGVIGIVSSRITEKYSRPSILISFKKHELEEEGDGIDIGKGSGRSIKGLNLVDALCHCSDLLVKFGGHELAAGLSVERDKLELFKKKINEYALNNLSEEDMIPTLEADCNINFDDVSLQFAEQLQMLEPYGVGNPMPVFTLSGIFVNEMTGVSDGKHTRFVFGDGKLTASAMYFSHSPDSLGLHAGDFVDVLFSIDVNEWLGRRSVQLLVKDIKPSKVYEEKINLSRSRFEEIRNGASYTDDENILPSREDFALLYRFIVASVRAGEDVLTHLDLMAKLSRQRDHDKIGYAKLKIMIMVFTELNIVGIEEIETETYRFRLNRFGTKTDLEKSNLLRKLRCQKIKSKI